MTRGGPPVPEMCLPNEYCYFIEGPLVLVLSNDMSQFYIKNKDKAEAESRTRTRQHSTGFIVPAAILLPALLLWLFLPTCGAFLA